MNLWRVVLSSVHSDCKFWFSGWHAGQCLKAPFCKKFSNQWQNAEIFLGPINFHKGLETELGKTELDWTHHPLSFLLCNVGNERLGRHALKDLIMSKNLWILFWSLPSGEAWKAGLRGIGYDETWFIALPRWVGPFNIIYCIFTKYFINKNGLYCFQINTGAKTTISNWLNRAKKAVYPPSFHCITS